MNTIIEHISSASHERRQTQSDYWLLGSHTALFVSLVGNYLFHCDFFL